MKADLENRLLTASDYFLDRLAEPSTWQGVGFIAALFGSHYAGLPWGQAAGLGGAISASIKMVLPEPGKKEAGQ